MGKQTDDTFFIYDAIKAYTFFSYNNTTYNLIISPTTGLTFSSGVITSASTINVATTATFKGPLIIPVQATGAAPTGGTAGQLVFDTSNNKLWAYNGSAWKSTTLA